MAINNRLSILQSGIFRGSVSDAAASTQLTELMQSIHTQVQNLFEGPSTLAQIAFQVPPGFIELTQAQIAAEPNVPDLEQRLSQAPEQGLPEPQGANTIWLETGKRTDWFKTTDGSLLAVVTKIREQKKFEIQQIVITEETSTDGSVTKSEQQVTQVNQQLTEQEMKDLLDKQSGAK